MTLKAALLRDALGRTRSVLDRFGILGSPVQDIFYARRAPTIGRLAGQVGTFISEERNAANMFMSGERPSRRPGPQGAASNGRWGRVAGPPPISARAGDD